MFRVTVLSVFVSVALCACGDDTDSDKKTEEGDACEAGWNGAADTVGCNGAIPGAQSEGQLGGTCTPDDSNNWGTCDDGLWCWYDDGMPLGLCVTLCELAETPYSTGGCPTGYKCITEAGEAACYPDCSATSDCSTGLECPDWYGCNPPEL